MSGALPTVSTMDLSHNGWPVVRSDRTWPLPAVTGSVLAGPVWVVFNWLARQYAARVEPIRRDWSWGYAYRQVRAGSAWSNHASATAVDFNAPAHPMSVRGTMTAAQAAACRQIETDSAGILNWGDNIPDEMHWEIAKRTSGDAVAAFATRILQAALGLAQTGVRDNTLDQALRNFQAARGLDVDGIDGPKTWAQLDNSPAPTPTPPPTQPGNPTTPDWPLDNGCHTHGTDAYFGPQYPLKNRRSVSGVYTHSADLKTWQQRMIDRGWRLTATGVYDADTKRVARAFQAEKNLKVDALIGRDTWAAAWTTPVTND